MPIIFRWRPIPPRTPAATPRGPSPAMLAPPNPFYFGGATIPPEAPRRNTETIEKTIPVMADLADNDLQRLALQRLKARTVALREGLAKLSEQLASRTD